MRTLSVIAAVTVYAIARLDGSGQLRVGGAVRTLTAR